MFIFERSAFINASSEPKLWAHVPMCDFISQMNGSLNNVRVTGFDSFETIISRVTDTRSMHCTLTQLPPKIVLEPEKSNTKEWVIHDI